MGIVACGIGYNYLMEVFGGNCPYPVVKVSQYPLPRKMITKLAESTEKLLVLEEGYPIVEEALKGYLEKNVYSRTLGRHAPQRRRVEPGSRSESIRITFYRRIACTGDRGTSSTGPLRGM